MKPLLKAEAYSQGSTLYLGQLLVLHFGCQLMLICAYFTGSAGILGFSFYIKKESPLHAQKETY